MFDAIPLIILCNVNAPAFPWFAADNTLWFSASCKYLYLCVHMHAVHHN